jgi:hypothetical protein
MTPFIIFKPSAAHSAVSKDVCHNFKHKILMTAEKNIKHTYCTTSGFPLNVNGAFNIAAMA